MILTPRFTVFLNLFLVYISWGSVYIGFKFTLEVLGPFFACAARMIFAGILLCLWLIVFGRWQRPTLADWRQSAWMAIFMVVVASGFLSKGQESVSSGVAAIITGSTPISMLLGTWLFGGESRPTLAQFTGLAGGLLGLALLAPASGESHSTILGCLWVFSATLGWVTGTIIIKRQTFKSTLPALQTCGMLLLAGGLECLFIGLLGGELAETHFEQLDLRIGIAFAWMVIGGSIIAYSCYFWLALHVSTALAISYEYVVPLIGVFLGWQLGGEKPTLRMLLACIIIIGSVFFVVLGKKR